MVLHFTALFLIAKLLKKFIYTSWFSIPFLPSTPSTTRLSLSPSLYRNYAWKVSFARSSSHPVCCFLLHSPDLANILPGRFHLLATVFSPGALLPWCFAFLRFPPQWHLLTSLTCVPDVTVACRPHSTSLTYLFILLWYPLLSSAQVESCWLSRRRLSGFLSPPPCLPLSEPSHMAVRSA